MHAHCHTSVIPTIFLQSSVQVLLNHRMLLVSLGVFPSSLLLSLSLSSPLPPPLVILPSSLCLLSPSHSRTIRFHRHPLTSSSRRQSEDRAAPCRSVRACVHSHSQLQWRVGKTRCQFGLDPIQVEAPPGFVILTGFSISCVQEPTELERKLGKETGEGGAGSGTSSRKSLHRRHRTLSP